MITSFRHKALEALFLYDQSKGLQQSQVRRLRGLLLILNNAHAIGDIDRPGLNLHPLKGGRVGFWSIRVDGNYRLIFRFEDGDALDVDLVDYH
ncbi:MAG: type II toxin-antitoxin system RelE/ParE family toxin [Chloracidobacterium sp.]|nr:type II toxin-antitoxin system RelE/ParE family toxin [Chloracidobacterium sp.]